MIRFDAGRSAIVGLLFAGCSVTPPLVQAPVAANAAEPTAVLPAPPPPLVDSSPSEENAAVPISPSDPVWGSRTAQVTLVVFADFQCPFCARLEPTLSQIKSSYGGSVRIVWKNNPLPFHPNAAPAAEAGAGVAALAGKDAFWRFHDLAFEHQSALSPESYEQWAAAAGVDLAAFRRGVAAHAWADKVRNDVALAAHIGVTGTPATFVNGVLVSGAQPYETWKPVIDAELAKAAALVDGGTPRDRVYLTLAAKNFTRKPATPDAPGKAEDTTTVFKVPIGKAPVRGKATAQVTIVEFADFQCPYCKHVEPTLDQIRSTYGDKVRIVWKDEPLPFHPRAEPSAQLAREALAERGAAGFWIAHDALFASQPKLEDVDLDTVAASVGLDLGKVHHAIEKHVYRAQIESDEGLAEDFTASGTPHFFINGRRLVGAQPFDRFKAIIDEEIRHADTVLARGTAPAALYDVLIKDGRLPPEPEVRAIAPRASAPSKGNTAAPVVMEEIGDFQCPFCKRAEDTVKELAQRNGANVRIVWRNMPLPMHPDAPLAAEAALEAYQQQGAAGFWKMHDMLFENQPTAAAPDGLKRAALDLYAQRLGLDLTRWNAALDGRTHRADVDADVRAASAAGITGVPAFIVGGYFVSGAQPLSKFQRLIDRVLAGGPAHPRAPAAIAP